MAVLLYRVDQLVVHAAGEAGASTMVAKLIYRKSVELDGRGVEGLGDELAQTVEVSEAVIWSE